MRPTLWELSTTYPHYPASLKIIFALRQNLDILIERYYYHVIIDFSTLIFPVFYRSYNNIFMFYYLHPLFQYIIYCLCILYIVNRSASLHHPPYGGLCLYTRGLTPGLLSLDKTRDAYDIILLLWRVPQNSS